MSVQGISCISMQGACSVCMQGAYRLEASAGEGAKEVAQCREEGCGGGVGGARQSSSCPVRPLLFTALRGSI